METQKQFIDKLVWIHVKDRKVLHARSKGKNIFYVPGGKRETGETDQQALIREIKEELQIDLKPETLQLFGIFEAQAHGKPEGVMVRMTCYTGEFNGKIKPSSEIEEVGWMTHAYREHTSPVDKLILDNLKERNLID